MDAEARAGGPEDGGREPPKLVRRLREQRERHLERRLIVRAAFVLAGVIVLLSGLAMLVLPGPALLVIPIGLALLSLEFASAEKLLERALEQADRGARRATETTPLQRVLAVLAIAAALGAALALGIHFGIWPL